MAAAVNARRYALLSSCCLYCFLTLAIHFRRAGSLSFNFTFSNPQSPANLHELINCTGDATMDTESLQLTRNRYDEPTTTSTGRAQYVQAVPLWDRSTGEMASFTTTFHFKITPDNSSGGGDGMAFFLGYPQAGIPADSNGGGLALLPKDPKYWNGTEDARIVAVEFDTVQNLEYADRSRDHVGIDVNSLVSTASTDTVEPKSLRSSFTNMATVTYHNVTKLLVADLRIHDTSYKVNATVDLRSYLPEHVAVGFSAATCALGEMHKVLWWSFTSTLEPKTPAAAAPPPQRPDYIITSNKQHPKRSVGVLIPVLVPLLSLLTCAAVVGLIVLLWRQHKSKQPSNNPDDDDSDCEEQQARAELERGVAATGPRRYAYGELAAATSNFAEDEKLGRGGFGSVYLGKLAAADVCGGQEQPPPVAIKKFTSESSAQGRKEFEAEVRIISRLKHRNLVQLLGWCDSRNGLLLVYELLAKGSLDKHLYSSHTLLTWPQRYQIILGLGSALRYLHQEWEQCVVHGDIKPSNIMLDESLGTRLGDFGLARLGEHGARWHTTRTVLGTAGYIDPEFVNTRHPSTESDVYSFGIVLLELVSSRPPVILQQQEEGGGGPHFILLKYVWGLYGRNSVLDAADPRLRGRDELDDKRMERVLVVGLWCAHPEQSERPSIAQAMHVLQSEDARLPALPPHMYRTVSDFAALSIQSNNSGGASSSTTTTDEVL